MLLTVNGEIESLDYGVINERHYIFFSIPKGSLQKTRPFWTTILQTSLLQLFLPATSLTLPRAYNIVKCLPQVFLQDYSLPFAPTGSSGIIPSIYMPPILLDFQIFFPLPLVIWFALVKII